LVNHLREKTGPLFDRCSVPEAFQQAHKPNPIAIPPNVTTMTPEYGRFEKIPSKTSKPQSFTVASTNSRHEQHRFKPARAGPPGQSKEHQLPGVRNGQFRGSSTGLAAASVFGLQRTGLSRRSPPDYTVSRDKNSLPPIERLETRYGVRFVMMGGKNDSMIRPRKATMPDRLSTPATRAGLRSLSRS